MSSAANAMLEQLQAETAGEDESGCGAGEQGGRGIQPRTTINPQEPV